jgi:hypothetical protein
MLALHQVRADVFYPPRIDSRHGACVDLRGLNLLGAHDPRRSRLELPRTRVNGQFDAVGTEVFTLLAALGHLRQQTGQQRAMNRRILSRLRIQLELQLTLDDFHHLAVHVMPFREPNVGKIVLLAPSAKLGAR